jgi:hypothetical protein
MRDKAGALQRGSLQARDRQEALQKIRALGGTPVNVTESSVPKTPFVWQPAWTRAAVVLSAAVVLIAVVVLYLQRSRTPPRPAPAPKPASVAPSGTKTPRPADTPRPDTPPANPRTGIASPRVPATGPAPVAPPAGPGGTATSHVAQVTPDAANEPLEEAPPVRPTPFKTGTEQILAIIQTTPPGVQMPPLPDLHGMEEDYRRATTNVLTIFDTDSDELAGTIENVAWAKVELGELVKQGWKPDEVLQELTRQHNEEASLRTAASLALKKMVDDGQFTAATLKEELEVINAELKERGLPEIMPSELGLIEE